MATTTEPLTTTTVDYFESVYADAGGDATLVPWASRQPSKALVNWLNAVAPSLVRCGARVAVVGCGLGDDAREVIRRGYDVTAFDCSATAVDWARRLDPVHAESYVHADLFEPPLRWRRRHDLVIDTNNLHYLEPGRRCDAMSALAGLLAPHGHLLVICRGADEPLDVDGGPPWPLTEVDLVEAADSADLVPAAAICCFTDDDEVRRIRAVLRRK